MSEGDNTPDTPATPDGPDGGDTRIAMIDGRNALAMVLVVPGPNGEGVAVEAHADGISKTDAALVLRHVADMWDPPTQ